MDAQSVTWICPRHGESDVYLHIAVYDPKKPGDSIVKREVVLERHYCLHCFVEKMDALGLKDMDRK